MRKRAMECRKFREHLLADPYRPGYHFAIPDGNGNPGDPNGAFFADGRYHLMYLYENDETQGYHWGHISSLDLLHWRHHPDALTIENGDKGCYSGGAFVDDDGTAYLTFSKFPSVQPGGDKGGIGIAFAKPPYDVWERIYPIAVESVEDAWGITDIMQNGKKVHLCSADPSNIWKENGMYYMQAGNKRVLYRYGLEENAPAEYKGDWTDVFCSEDLKTWRYSHRLYKNTHLGPDWPDDMEDDMCPSLFPMPDKRSGGALTENWMQVFISHTKGAQYYIGKMDNARLIPEKHGRFSWNSRMCFAPEELMDDKNRRIVWFWLIERYNGNFFDSLLSTYGWFGVFSFPRVLWLEGDELRMAPAEELDKLQYNGCRFECGCLNGRQALTVKNGRSFRLRVNIEMGSAQKAGFGVCVDEAGGEETQIYYDAQQKQLVLNAANSGYGGEKILQTAPFDLRAGEKLSLDIFVDKSIVEVYANERQAIAHRVYPTNPANATGVYAFADDACFSTVRVWEMAPTNPC